MPHTKLPTSHGPNPAAGPFIATTCEKIAPTSTTSTAVPNISLKMFAKGLRTAALVQKTPSFAAGSGVSRQCGA